jgi:hypothetical protein
VKEFVEKYIWNGWGYAPDKGSNSGCFIARGVRTMILWYLRPVWS